MILKNALDFYVSLTNTNGEHTNQAKYNRHCGRTHILFDRVYPLLNLGFIKDLTKRFTGININNIS